MTGIDARPTAALWGYSAGARATLLAARFQPGYVPDLRLAGAAVGGVSPLNSGPVQTILEILKYNKGIRAFYIVIMLLGLGAQSPDIERLVREHLKPQFRDKFYASRQLCLEAGSNAFAHYDVLGMFDSSDFLVSNRSVLEFLSTNDRPEAVPEVPLLWYRLAKDDFDYPDDAKSLIDEYCAKGAVIQHHVETAPDIIHVFYALVGAPVAIDWLEGVMDGRRPGPGCSQRVVRTRGFNLSSIKAYTEKFVDGFQRTIDAIALGKNYKLGPTSHV